MSNKFLKIKAVNETFRVNNIFCIGKNYLMHIKEFGGKEPEKNPVIFTKPNSAIISDREEVVIPEYNGRKISGELHYETELVVAIGKELTGDNISDCIKGYAVGFDMTLRDVQDEAKQKGLPWTTAKGFRTSAPVSDIVLKHEIINPDNINFMGFVNGELKQSVNTSEMIISINEILKYIDSIFSLQSGDLIFTGTPAGVGKVKSGDLLEASLVNLVQLKVRVS